MPVQPLDFVAGFSDFAFFLGPTNNFAELKFDGKPLQSHEPGEDDPIIPHDEVPPRLGATEDSSGLDGNNHELIRGAALCSSTRPPSSSGGSRSVLARESPI